MKRAIDETDRRREIQLEYNIENGITPETIVKPVDMVLVAVSEADYVAVPSAEATDDTEEDPTKIGESIEKLENEMREAAKRFEFERAAELRDRAKALRAKQLEVS